MKYLVKRAGGANVPLARIIPLILVLLINTTATGNASALTEAIQKRYAGITSVTTDFTQTLYHKETDTTEERTGTLKMKKATNASGSSKITPLTLIRWETKTPTTELLIVTKELVWNYLADEEVAYKYPASLVHESKTILRFLSGTTNLADEFYLETGKKEGQLQKTLLFAKEPTQEMTEATIWTDDDNIVQRVKVVDFFGNENTISFSNLMINVPLKSTLFTFTPPAGVDVEDRTEGRPQSTQLTQ